MYFCVFAAAGVVRMTGVEALAKAANVGGIPAGLCASSRRHRIRPGARR